MVKKFNPHIYAWAIALALVGLILIMLWWEARGAPLRPGGSWWLLKGLPLLLFLRSALQLNIYRLRLLLPLLCLYLAEATSRLDTSFSIAQWLWPSITIAWLIGLSGLIIYYIRRAT